MTMAVGSDSTSHFATAICAYLEEKGVELLRCGQCCGEQADYVDAARAVAEHVAAGRCDQGLLFCTTGTGVTIIANKIPGVRAALCVDAFSARIARLANNANVLVLSMRYTGEMLGREIVDEWLTTEPSTEPRRVNFHRKTEELDAMYRGASISKSKLVDSKS
ncbi:MAG: RpiB/LacA/LacB family sugar-phosphate isomerase [Acidobacteriaceae bacterium]|jgi:ribose 5-phosphate isomerase B